MDQATHLLWRNFVLYSFENSWSANRVIFSEFLWIVASEYSPADKNMSKFDNKGMFQECYSDVFIINLENIFEVCHGV